MGAARDRQRGRVRQVLLGPHDRGLRARDMGHARDAPRAAEPARDDARQGLTNARPRRRTPRSRLYTRLDQRS